MRVPRFACWLVLPLSAVVGRAQTVVDDFSSDQIAANYSLMTGAVSGTPGVTVSGGTLQLQDDSGTSAYIWNGPGGAGLALTNVGDSASVPLRVVSGAEVGMTLWNTSTVPGNGEALAAARLVSARYTTSHDGENLNGLFLNNDNGTIYTALDGAPTGFSTLTIAITGKTGSDTTISITFSGSGFSTISGTDVYSTIDPIYFGPSLYQSTAQFDNLTFTSAIPEPSTGALFTGLVALMLVLARRTSRIKR